MNARIVPNLTAAALILAICAGCSSDPAGIRLIILTEQSTGCQYVGRLSSGIVPANFVAIVDASGKPVCKAIARAEAAQ